MSWIWWVVILAIAAGFVIDWLIVMGPDPKKWKGGRKG